MNITTYYESLKNDQNNISYWYPKIRNCGMSIPKTQIFTVPERIVKAFYMEGNMQQNIDEVYEWVKSELTPLLKPELQGLIFMKNGAYSNKFDFSTCATRATAIDITRNLIEINYASLMFETGGNAEVAIRERIISNENEVPCIYNGMPLRNEYRLFYDFDNNKPLYIVNYWDWEYCHDAISRNVTDKIVYETIYPQLNKHYEEKKDVVMENCRKALKCVSGLSGIWSVDIMEDETGTLWLIDMAIGERSAYWNPKLAV